MRVPLLLAVFTITGTGCSANAWNSEVPQSPLLGIENGIWRFPTPQPPPSADGAPAPSASPAADEPSLGKPKRRTRMPKPYAVKPEPPGEVLTLR